MKIKCRLGRDAVLPGVQQDCTAFIFKIKQLLNFSSLALLGAEDETTMVLRNAGSHKTNDMAAHPSGLYLQQPQIPS
jgi:hypothetical protein